MLLEKIKNVLKTRKVKLFFLFLLLSTLAWFISNLSDRYQSNTSFALNYINSPENMMLVNATTNEMDFKLDAIGYQFLALNLSTREVELNLDDIVKKGLVYYLPPQSSKRQIEGQLKSGIMLLDTEKDTLFFEFYGVVNKKVPVIPVVNLEMQQNYILNKKVRIIPDSINVKGPSNEVDSLDFLKTNPINLSNISENFQVTAKIAKVASLKNTEFSTSEVAISGEVTRFTEKMISVPVQILNLPADIRIQTFPDKVDVLIKASIEEMKNIDPQSITVVGDYKTIENKDVKRILLRINKQPQGVHSAELSTNKVDFVLKRP